MFRANLTLLHSRHKIHCRRHNLQKTILTLEHTIGIALKFLPAFWAYFTFGNSPFAILQFQFSSYLWFLGHLIAHLLKAVKAAFSFMAKQNNVVEIGAPQQPECQACLPGLVRQCNHPTRRRWISVSGMSSIHHDSRLLWSEYHWGWSGYLAESILHLHKVLMMSVVWNECKGKEETQPVHVPTALQSRGDSVTCSKCCKLYTFPRDFRSHNIYKKNYHVQKRQLYANGMRINPSKLRLTLISSYICKNELWGIMNLQMRVNKIKNVSLCPCLPTTQSSVQGKKYKYISSHLPGFMFIFALCFLNEPFIQSHGIFTIFYS